MIRHLSKLINGLALSSLATAFVACSEQVSFNELDSTERILSPTAPAPNPNPSLPLPGNPELPIEPTDGFFSKSQSINVQGDDSDVDILFVIDNSGSMAEEQSQLATRISGFMNMIVDLNWQIAMTTTDATSLTYDRNRVARHWSDGGFRPFDHDDGRKFVLKAGEQSESQAQRKLATAIRMGISGSSDERGIQSVYRAIERRQGSSAHQQFFRQDASLAVILISDEDECSKYVCSAEDSYKSSPQGLQNFVKAEFGLEKKFNFHSIISIPNDSSCGSAQNMGNTYQTMSQISDGIVGSICAENYSSILHDIGNKVVEQVTSVNIECSPEDVKNPNGIPRVLITLANGDILLSHQYKLKGQKLVFEKPLPEGQHTITYLCPQI